MRRRGPGLAAVKNKHLVQNKYKDKGNEIAEDQFAQLSKQMDTFKGYLEDFAAQHKDDIKKDSEFRVQFQEMCASIGVDPLASSKGFWAEMLGVGDFYYELGVQIIEVCLATSHRNGGLIMIEELRDKLVKSRSKKSQDISIDDLIRAIKKLKALGNGFCVLPVGTTYMIQSIPGELSLDHTAIIQQAQALGNGFCVLPVGTTYMIQSIPGELSLDQTAIIQKAQSTAFVTRTQLKTNLNWEQGRANRALNDMVKEGLIWIDDQDKTERKYWFPSLFTAASAS